MHKCISDSRPIRCAAGGGVSLRGAKKLGHVVKKMAETPVQASAEYGAEIRANIIQTKKLNK